MARSLRRRARLGVKQLSRKEGVMQRLVQVAGLYGRATLALLTVSIVTACGGAQQPPAEAPAEETATPDSAQLTRLYVFDCGRATLTDVSEFSLSNDEVSTTEVAAPCFLIEHEQGTLMWDLGLSEALYPDGTTIPEGPLAGSTMTVERTLTSQLAELGYAPGDIDYFAMSHMHFDHSGNANLFEDVTWLAREAERDYAFGEPEGLGWDQALYEGLRDVEPVLIEGHHDVFRDGTVVLRSAPGHTPGHQVLFIDLAETGPVVLSGDLYHFPESRELRRVPLFNYDEAQTLASMDAVEAFLEESGADLWIEHDFIHNATLKKSPEYYQ